MTVIEKQKAIGALKETIEEIKEIGEDTDLLILLNRVIDRFEEKINNSLDSFETDEGFVDLGESKSKAIYVRLDNRGNTPWYIWNSQKQERDYIHKPKLKGSLRYIVIKEDQNQALTLARNISKPIGKPMATIGKQEIQETAAKKVIIYIECQQKEGREKYGIVTGHTTIFSRQFIWKVHNWIKENKWQGKDGKEFKLSIIPERIVSQTGKSYIACRLFDANENPLVPQENPPEDWGENDWDQYLEKAVEEINTAIAGDEVADKLKETEVEESAMPPMEIMEEMEGGEMGEIGIMEDDNNEVDEMEDYTNEVDEEDIPF